jgi:hypothetical protein
MMRRLKIAVSALSLIACVSVLVFWIRAQQIYDSFGFPLSNATSVHIQTFHNGIHAAESGFDWEWRSYETPNDVSVPLWNVSPTSNLWAFAVPYWFAFVMTGFGAVAPWILTRFNLRTLLLVLTFAAMVMGAIAYQA